MIPSICQVYHHQGLWRTVLSQFFFVKPALEKSLINFSCSRRSPNFCSYSPNKFTCTSASVWGIWLAVGFSVGKNRDSRSSSAPGLTVPLESLANSPLPRRHWADWLKWLFEESTQWFHHYHWSEWISLIFLCFSTLLFPRRWMHEIQDDRFRASAVLSHSSSLWAWVPYHFFSDPGNILVYIFDHT